MQLLIVDDDAVSAALLCRRVEALGHQALHEADGEAAWERLLRDDTVDAVLSGWHQPGILGLELCERVAGLDRFVPFIFVTGVDDRPLQLQGMRAGAVGYLTKPTDQHELQMQLIAAQRLVDLHHTLAAREAELRRLNALLYQQGRRDRLTGIPNRRRLDEDLARLHAAALAEGAGHCVVMMDLDRFKRFNDAHGHLAGDTALRTVAATLRDTSRTGDRLYRYGGEEFLLHLPLRTTEAALPVLERLRGTVAGLHREAPEAVPSPLTISMGVAALDPHQPVSPDVLIRRADEALYAAKRAGRDRVVAWPAAPSGRSV